MGRVLLFVCLALPACSVVADLGNSYQAAPDGAPMADSGFADTTTAPDARAIDAPPNDFDATAADANGLPRVFLSSETFTGGFTNQPAPSVAGLSGADDDCQRLAARAGLQGTFVAWLVLSGTATESPIQDVTGGWFLRSGTPVASSVDQLLSDAGPTNPIVETEDGSVLTSRDDDLPTWTGFVTEANCQGWENGTDEYQGEVGNALLTGPRWLVDAMQYCDLPARLYCFQQP